MERLMARQTKWLWRRGEKRSICAHATAPGVSVAQVAQVARRYAMNANMIFKWLRDPRYAPEPGAEGEAGATNIAGFLPVSCRSRGSIGPGTTIRLPTPASAPGMIEIDIAGGPRLRISGAYDPEALARLDLAGDWPAARAQAGADDAARRPYGRGPGAACRQPAWRCHDERDGRPAKNGCVRLMT